MVNNQKIYGILEAVIGRRFLSRLGRFLYLGSRRELNNSPEANGEYLLVGAMSANIKAGGRHICLDVGANLGDWTAELLDAAGDSDIQVYAFEPAPAQFAHIEGRFPAEIDLSRVSPQKLALAAAPGKTSFVVTGDDSGNNAIATGNAVVSGDRISVKLDTVDRFCARNRLPALSFVKVDTEGNDYNVIAGAQTMLASGSIALLQFEYNWRWVAFGHVLREVFELVEGMDYAVAQVTQGGLEVHGKWHPELERFFETNFALVRSDILPTLPHRHVNFDAANLLSE
jgi:FkbM family methyltransferase